MSATVRKEDFQEKAASVRDAIYDMHTELQKYAVGQTEYLEALILAVVAKQHVVAFGPPGTNKSNTIDRLTHCIGADIRNAAMEQMDEGLDIKPPNTAMSVDEYLNTLPFTFKVTLDKYATPEALLGPVSVNKWRQHDRYERNLEQTLADAEFAILEELFSANGATLRTLVRALNERQIENGGRRHFIPLRTVFGATNEEPPAPMAAVYDRFMVRVVVNPLDTGNYDQFMAMMHVPDVPIRKMPRFLSLRDLEVAHAASMSVTIEEGVERELFDLRGMLASKKELSYISPRRWMVARKLLKSSAWLRGSDTVESPDLWFALRYVLWDRITQKKIIEDELRPHQTMTGLMRDRDLYQNAVDIFNEAKGDDVDVERRMQATAMLSQIASSITDAKQKQLVEDMADKLDAMTLT